MEKLLKKTEVDVLDFPKKGIIFKDLTPVLKDKKVFKKLIDVLYKRYKTRKIDKVVCVEARGFLIGAPLAYKLGAGLVPVRKPGKLPRDRFKIEYALEYGTDALEIHKDAIDKGDRVLLLDDVLATGGTVAAVISLLENFDCKLEEVAFVMELDFLKGRKKLGKNKVFSVVHY